MKEFRIVMTIPLPRHLFCHPLMSLTPTETPSWVQVSWSRLTQVYFQPNVCVFVCA